MYTGIHLYLHLPAIHAYTNSASSVANRDRDSNSYTYFDTETFSDAESCANARSSSYTAAAPVAFADEEEAHCLILLNCLDSFDALRVKDVYAPKRKQGESEH